jgi:magnesium-transporting ATPase (P-type)
MKTATLIVLIIAYFVVGRVLSEIVKPPLANKEDKQHILFLWPMLIFFIIYRSISSCILIVYAYTFWLCKYGKIRPGETIKQFLIRSIKAATKKKNEYKKQLKEGDDSIWIPE